MDLIYLGLLLVAIGIAVYLILELQKSKATYTTLYERFKDIIDLEAHKAKLKSEAEEIVSNRDRQVSDLDQSIKSLRQDYSDKRKFLENLLKEIALYEDQNEVISYGLYKPHFDFDTSEKYKEALVAVREQEKALVRDDQAARSEVTWTVGGSAAEGKRMIKHYSKLMLRAFNGECEALISDVRWNNISRMEERLEKAYEAINKLGETQQVGITPKYKKLKLDELRLSYEYQERLHQEKEEQKRIQEQIREEEKAQKEIEKALKDSEDEEKKYNKALDQARKEMEKAHGDALVALQERMAQLQTQLEEAQKLKERALSMAQQTKAGHVYVISNIGSFGEDVFKIGMTRRLDPMDRVKELGDASVPFEFDVHAMIYSDNAPELENIMHKEFEVRRVNLVNTRKEFFQVSLDKIEEIAAKRQLNVEFTKIAEAREFRESQVIRESMSKKKPEPTKTVLDEMPLSI
jgi:hypothetical protein